MGKTAKPTAPFFKLNSSLNPESAAARYIVRTSAKAQLRHHIITRHWLQSLKDYVRQNLSATGDITGIERLYSGYSHKIQTGRLLWKKIFGALRNLSRKRTRNGHGRGILSCHGSISGRNLRVMRLHG